MISQSVANENGFSNVHRVKPTIFNAPTFVQYGVMKACDRVAFIKMKDGEESAVKFVIQFLDIAKKENEREIHSAFIAEILRCHVVIYEKAVTQSPESFIL